MIQIAQGWQLAVERGPGWLFVRPFNLFQPDDGLSQADDGLSGQSVGFGDPRRPITGDVAIDAANEPSDAGQLDLAEQVCQLLEQNFTRRVVLELDQIGCLTSDLVGQLVLLQDRILAEGGVIRVCGLSSANEAVLSECGLLGRFLCYNTRPDAVMGYRPPRPR
jgi:anti-anti-sigma regulatory factor